MAEIKKIKSLAGIKCKVILAKNIADFQKLGLSSRQQKYVKEQQERSPGQPVLINDLDSYTIAVLMPAKKDHQLLEALRNSGGKTSKVLNGFKQAMAGVAAAGLKKNEVLAFAEGMALANYQFLKYKSDAAKERNSLRTINITSSEITDRDIDLLNISLKATCTARDLVNEPVIYLNAVQLAKEAQKLGKEAGFKVEVLNKPKIESLKMGGLLAVNMGSQQPPTFTMMEYKPAKAGNKKPYLLVGKGVVYDTGGLSLKPTPNSMDSMKCDMAGAAAVICTMYAVAKAKLPVHLVALVPATDNRPGENAYTPGDVITMYSGKKVEVLNTDAEGRMILADALTYAKKYDPSLVIDLATLTGAAAAAIGKYGIVCMGTASENVKEKLKRSGDNVYERLAEMPFWDEYGELIKSSVADIKNIGGPYAGAITAGKFLEHFVSYPWMHFDIAGPAFLQQAEEYKPSGGSGVGVRLLFDFFKNV